MSYFDDNEDYIIYGRLARGDDDESWGRQRTTECTRCGKSGLHWEETDVGFALYDNRDRKHVCPAVKPSADDFDDLS